MSTNESPMLNYAYFNGKIVPFNQANLSISSQSVQYGLTCFAGLRAYKQGEEFSILRLKEHFERFMNGSKILGMVVDLSFETFQNIIQDLISQNKPDVDIYIRPFFYTNDQYLGPRFDREPYQLGVYMQKLKYYLDPHVGLRLMVSSWRKYPDSSISVKAKAGGVYLNSALATTEARKNGYDEALLLDHQDHLCEASLANVIISYRGELYAPNVGAGALDGFTLRTCLSLLEDENIHVKREIIDRSMIYSADEVLLTGTAAQIIFGGSVDGRPIGDGQEGKICHLLRSKYKELIDGKHPRSSAWMHKFSAN